MPHRLSHGHFPFLAQISRTNPTIIQQLKKSTKFTWIDDCEQIFQKLKTTLTSPPILHKPDTHQPLLVYITTTDHTVSAALVHDVGDTQHPVYFVSRTLQDPKPDTKWWKSWPYRWYTEPATYAHTSKTTASLSKPITQFKKFCRNQT